MVLSKYLKSDFVPYLSEIIPKILYNISLYDENSDEYLDSLLSIIDSIQGNYLPYVEKTSELVLPLINIKNSESTRTLSASLGSVLIKVIKESGNKDFLAKIEHYSRMFLNAI